MTTVLDHPAVKAHLASIADGSHHGWDPVDYSAQDIPALIVDRDGKDAATNSAKYGAKWQMLPCTPNPLVLDAAIGANGKAQAFVNRPGMQGGDTEFLGFVAKVVDGEDGAGNPARFAVMPKSQSLNLELANRPICSSLIFGRGPVGAPWPTSFYEPGTGAIIFQCSNLAAAALEAEIVGIGRRFIGEEAQATIEARRAKFLTTRINPFFVGPDATDDYTVEFSLGPGQSLDLECTLPSVGDFLATNLRDDSTASGGGIPNFKMTITDGVSGYALMPEPVSVELIAAQSLAALDARLPAPSFDGCMSGLFTHVFARSSKILLHYESHETAKTITIRQALGGVILRYRPAPNRNTNTSEANRREILDRSVPTNYGNIVQGGRS